MLNTRELQLECAKLIGEPINYQLPVAAELSEIANVETIAPGEKLWRFTDVETTTDQVLVVNAGGAITVVERTPLGDTQISLSGLQSKLEYVEVNDILASPDLQILGRRKEAISRSMDKRELQALLSGIWASTETPSSVNVSSVTPASGEDLYDVIMRMKQAVEDYGTDYVLLVASDVMNKIETFDKDNASTFNYNVALNQVLAQKGMKVMKIFGEVDYNGSNAAVLAAGRMILCARNSRISTGKPVTFVRRQISPAIAELMGAQVDAAQRAILFQDTPVNSAGTNILGFGVYGYESIAFAIPNPKALCICDASTVIA